MIINVLDQMYKVGCGRGINGLEKPDLLNKLNAIIDWTKSEFPPKQVGEEEKQVTDMEGNIITETVPILKENRDFLGDDPELKPGNCFEYRGQIIAIDDPNTLVLIVSETGPFALERLWDEVISPEIELMYNDYPINSVNIEDVPENSIPENFEEGRIDWKYWRIWKDIFTKDVEIDLGDILDSPDIPEETKKIIRIARDNGTNMIAVPKENGGGVIDLSAPNVKKTKELDYPSPKKCTLDSDDFFLPVTVYMKENYFMYDPEEIEPDMVKDVVLQVIADTFNSRG